MEMQELSKGADITTTNIMSCELLAFCVPSLRPTAIFQKLSMTLLPRVNDFWRLPPSCRRGNDDRCVIVQVQVVALLLAALLPISYLKRLKKAIVQAFVVSSCLLRQHELLQLLAGPRCSLEARECCIHLFIESLVEKLNPFLALCFPNDNSKRIDSLPLKERTTLNQLFYNDGWRQKKYRQGIHHVGMLKCS